MDIVRTDSEQRALKAAKDSGKAGPRPAEGANDRDTDKQWAEYKAKLTETQSYKDVMKQYGVGSSFQQAAQAATAAIQALAGGDIKQAIAGGAAPYLAQLVKDATLPVGREPTAEERAANLMGHAVVGAVVAQLSGKDAGAGALGAASGELAAEVIRQKVFDGRDVKDLSESEKQSLGALSTLAAGLASGLASGNTADGASGAQAGRNAVENNTLGLAVRGCAALSLCRSKIAEQLLEIGAKAGIAGIAGLAGAAVKDLADKMTSDELDHLITLKMMGNDELTGKYLSSLQDKYAPPHTGGDQIAGSGPSNTGGDQLPVQSVNHTGNNNDQTDSGPNNTGGNQAVDPLPNNTGSTEAVPDQPNYMVSDGHDNGAEKPSSIKVADDKFLKNN